MLQNFKNAGLVLLFTVLAAACSKKQEAAPPPPPKAEATAPAQPPPAPAAPVAPAPAENYEGEWSGDSGENLPLSFSVAGNQVPSLSASYSGRNGTCSFNGSISSSGPAAIANKAFTAQGKSTREALEFTAQGTFTSPTEASGTLVWKGKSDLCGDIDLQYKWTAKKAAAEPTLE